MSKDGTAVKEKIHVKTPDGKKWEKIVALFDERSAHDYIGRNLAKKLVAEGEGGFEETVRLHVKVMGDEYSWPFSLSDTERGADLVFGQEFMKNQGVVIKGNKIAYAPGYPQGPMI
jgi:hypothetical protein